jgi:DNA polymerase III delta prime subunit
MDDQPANDISAVSPTSLAHIVGQRGVLEQVTVALDAAQMDAKKFDHALLVGPPGFGKTAVAKIVACEMASDFHELLGQSIGEGSENVFDRPSEPRVGGSNPSECNGLRRFRSFHNGAANAPLPTHPSSDRNRASDRNRVQENRKCLNVTLISGQSPTGPRFRNGSAFVLQSTSTLACSSPTAQPPISVSN